MSLKLTYFPAAGRAFVTRLCLRAAGVPFEDERIGFPALVALKGEAGFSPAVPLGQLPIITLPSGEVVTQSGAHFRWAAKKAGLYPADADAALLVDEVMHVCDEMSSKLPQHADKEVKKSMREAFVKDVMPKYMGFLEKKLAARGGKFFGGASIDVADLSLFTTFLSIKKGSWLESAQSAAVRALSLSLCILVAAQGLSLPLAFHLTLHPSLLRSLPPPCRDYIAPEALDSWPALAAHYEAVLSSELVVKHGQDL
jgi:glutathione S-transferase